MHKLALDSLCMPLTLQPWNSANLIRGQCHYQHAPHVPDCHELNLGGWKENPVVCRSVPTVPAFVFATHAE